MKTNVKIKIKLWIVLFISLLAFNSCGKYKEIADADYPGQVIYMPTAVGGIYYTNNTPNLYEVPTTGDLSRFYIDEGMGRLVIPLGVYRGGISYNGSLRVNISINGKTIVDLINEGTLTDVELLPSDRYTVPPSVEIIDGKESVGFNLNIDLIFLKANPNKKFAVSVEISSSAVAVNPQLNSTVVVFDTIIL